MMLYLKLDSGLLGVSHFAACVCVCVCVCVRVYVCVCLCVYVMASPFLSSHNWLFTECFPPFFPEPVSIKF